MIIHSEQTRDFLTDTRRLTLESAGMRMSLVEFDEVDDYEEGYRYELIHGVVVVTPSPSPPHSSSNDELGRLIRNYAADHPNGKCVDGTYPECDLITSSGKRRSDRGIWIGLGHEPDLDHDVPAIVIEFVSPGKAAYARDYDDKRAEYIELGCKEYWVIDRFRRIMTVFRSEGPPTVVAESEVYSTPLMPGLELPLTSLLRAADTFKKKS